MKMCVFGVATFFLAYCLSNLHNFSGVVRIYYIHVFNEAFFVLSTIVLINDKVYFSCFHGNHGQGNKLIHRNLAVYLSKLLYPRKVGVKQIKTTQKNCHKDVSSITLIRTQRLTMGSKQSKNHLFWILSTACYIAKYI